MTVLQSSNSNAQPSLVALPSVDGHMALVLELSTKVSDQDAEITHLQNLILERDRIIQDLGGGVTTRPLTSSKYGRLSAKTAADNWMLEPGNYQTHTTSVTLQPNRNISTGVKCSSTNDACIETLSTMDHPFKSFSTNHAQGATLSEEAGLVDSFKLRGHDSDITAAKCNNEFGIDLNKPSEASMSKYWKSSMEDRLILSEECSPIEESDSVDPDSRKSSSSGSRDSGIIVTKVSDEFVEDLKGPKAEKEMPKYWRSAQDPSLVADWDSGTEEDDLVPSRGSKSIESVHFYSASSDDGNIAVQPFDASNIRKISAPHDRKGKLRQATGGKSSSDESTMNSFGDCTNRATHSKPPVYKKQPMSAVASSKSLMNDIDELLKLSSPSSGRKRENGLSTIST